MNSDIFKDRFDLRTLLQEDDIVHTRVGTKYRVKQDGLHSCSPLFPLIPAVNYNKNLEYTGAVDPVRVEDYHLLDIISIQREEKDYPLEAQLIYLEYFPTKQELPEMCILRDNYGVNHLKISSLILANDVARYIDDFTDDLMLIPNQTRSSLVGEPQGMGIEHIIPIDHLDVVTGYRPIVPGKARYDATNLINKVDQKDVLATVLHSFSNRHARYSRICRKP